ncbi:lipid IV(A) 3-deoxy-D-manno-octulosonic acid transferase [Sulfurovum sp. XGS-02]|uniref:lipid IV(A) 3-deoxy-D-manno-octulosonic acid transferase n=1 Tax=Sulfurovum sp. XGS-02 TaxID=2925411 RepID=UPI002067E150|nr:lipid IV(A) 3-deoxy-D-manno-octulosonic acid transferase [Sulfurovum sp. XGS-02]UPT77822.1 lipid IV(A) 3-deoxy-D-manno-octulosonic acid transferase [Sulfurovum sp. XGS-02]
MEKLFFFLYSLLTFSLYLIALPFLVLFSFKTKYKDSLPARFFLWHNKPLKPDGIWFHSCSFGEAKAIKSLVERLPQESMRMSTTTHTGFNVIEGYTKESRYLPFEPLLLGWLKPQKALVVMEAEFWYLLFALAQSRGAKTLLINARMSDRSFPRYEKIGWLYREIFKHIDEVYAQTAKDKERLESLGAQNVVVTGNIKLAHLPGVTKEIKKPSSLVVCGASTHEGEEALILDAFAALKKEDPEAVLLLVPRHPERFDKVAKMMEAFAERYQLTAQRYSQNEVLSSDMILVDVLGELVNMYAISDIVILGGAFEPIGGHNAAEAAQFGCKIISGKHYFNQKDIFDAIEGIAVVEASNLSRRLLQHGLLKPTKIKNKSDITGIIESLERVL